MKGTPMKGYKAMHNGSCRDFKFEVGQTYKIVGKLEMCVNGFHFCQNIADINEYYAFYNNPELYEIEAVGEVITEGNKSATSEIRIVKRLTVDEFIPLLQEQKVYVNANLQWHREDGPAVECANGYKAWWVNGYRHREDGPAVEYADGEKQWWLYGQRHREDGPAIEYANGGKRWYLNGERHRVDGPALEYGNGDKEWYLNGRRHREDGPAIEYADGDKEWFLNGKCHREDGPAIECADGGKYWYLNGEPHREDEFNAEMIKRKSLL